MNVPDSLGASDIYLISALAGLCAHSAAEWLWRVAGHTWSCLGPALDELFYLLVHRNLVGMLQLQTALDLLVIGGQALHHREDVPRIVDGVALLLQIFEDVPRLGEVVLQR